MPISPGRQVYLGLGLWGSIPADVMIEGGFWLLAVIIYSRATHAKNRIGSYAYWSVVALLTVAWYNDPHAAPFVSLLFFSLAVAWAYWMNRARPCLEKSG
jgi:hypothetical protein